MVRRPGPLSNVHRAPARRQRASRPTIMVRRLLALVLLGGGIAAGVWLVSVGLSNVGSSKKPKSSPTRLVVLKIVFPEGFTRKQMAQRIVEVNRIAVRKRRVDPRLSASGYAKATRSSLLPGQFNGDRKRRQLEGFLFPATYEFLATTTSKRLVADQVKTFKRNWRKVSLRYARSKNLTPYDVLNIASMIEAEVKAPAERSKVSAVIYNRLRAHMPLGIDPTLCYGLDIHPCKGLTVSQLQDRNPYNTRVHLGLPPTPIGNPGLASIQAAAHPASVDYLYFVLKPDQLHHFFTESYDEFLAYKRKHGYRT